VPQNIFAKFLESEGSTRILASPRLRAAEGKPTSLRIGDEIPIPVTSFVTPTTTPGQNFGNATSFQYRNVGINLDLTPKVNGNGDISLDFNAEFSILGAPRNVGGDLSIPSVTTRNVKGVLRLRDGETSLIGGLVSSQETMSRSGALGIEKIPLLNRIFGQNKQDANDTEVLISITPHVVRAPKITEDDLVPLGVGTDELVRVQGARPSLFGEPEPEPEAPAEVAPAPPASQPRRIEPQALDPAAPPGAITDPGLAPSQTGADPGLPPPGPGTPPVSEGAPTAPEGPVSALFSPPELGLNVTATGTLALVLVGGRDLRSVDVSLTYDAKVVEAVDASPGSLLTLDGSSVSSQKALEAGRVRLRFSRTVGASGSGVIAALVFRGVAAGTTAIGVESVTLTTGAGDRSVALPPPGRIVVTP
jgi:general secretion pathway protein D